MAQLKPRLVVLTDISSWEPDDHESLIRMVINLCSSGGFSPKWGPMLRTLKSQTVTQVEYG